MDKRTRRVKGNSTPPDDDLPIQYWAPDEPEKSNDGQDVIDFLLAFTIIVIAIIVIMSIYGAFS